MQYVKQLDSLRAIAILLVIIHHWTPLRNPLHTYTSIFNGVDVFFILSGFLITRILLQNRKEADQMQLSKGTIVKSFFIRRVLRIFPIYYLLIFGLLLVAPTTGSTIRENFIYYVTYTANIHFFNIQGWDGMLSHLWSLSVEEQFYLLWPWLMLFPRRSWLLPIIVMAISTGVAAQLLLPHGGMLTFSCLDGFGAGAFMAWALVCKPTLVVRTKMLWPLLAIAGLGLQLLRMLEFPIPVPSRTSMAFIITWLILTAVKEQPKPWLFELILKNRLLIFLGKISYGMYLYHLVIPHYTYDVLYKINHLLPASVSWYHIYLYRLENFILVVIVAYLSWRLIEQPALKLKKYAAYRKPVALPAKKKALQPALSRENLDL